MPPYPTNEQTLLSLLRIADGLSEKGTLVWLQREFFRQGGLVAVVEPGSQAQRCAGQIDILGDQAGINEVIGLLDLCIVQARLRKSGGLELVEIDHIDQPCRSIGAQLALAWPDRQIAAVAGDNRSQLVGSGLV